MPKTPEAAPRMGGKGGRKGTRRATKKGRPGGARPKRRGGMPVSSMPVGAISLAAGGFGFVETPEGRFFVPRDRTGGAMDGDTVRLRPRSSNWQRQAARAQDEKGASRASQAGRRAPIAAVDRVLEHTHSSIVGTFALFDGIAFVIPQDMRLDFLFRARCRAGLGVSEGDVVVLEIESYPSRYETPSGVVTRVLGREGDPRVVEEAIAARHGLQTEFSPEALAEADAAVLDVDAALAEPDRIDERDRFVLTIDPVDARDFDDALSFAFCGELRRIGVHIADVSHYVTWDSALDRAARQRATSTYFPDRVIPMLPERLSCGLCSLNPGEDRLAFTVDLYLDGDGRIVRAAMHPSVICSRLRLDYGSVQGMFDGALGYPSPEARATLEGLRKAADRLRARRIKRGALDFSSTELKVIVDPDGEATGIAQRRRNAATDLVEEAMIAANEAVAAFMLGVGAAGADSAVGAAASAASSTGPSGAASAPMVYRVHDAPNVSSIEEIVPALRGLGYAKEAVPVTGAQIQSVLDAAKGRPEEAIVDMLLLRAMKQAVYRDSFSTHFGLASEGYTHFTSPIRRYPDILAHRLLRSRLFEEARRSGRFPPRPDGSVLTREQARTMPLPRAIEGLKPMKEQLSSLCEHSSTMERVAEKASREALDAKICEYMGRFVGHSFTTTIVNVMPFGFFVQIDEGQEGAGCEGLVPVRDLDGWYDYDDEHRVLRDVERSHKASFALGQRVEAILVSADIRKGRLSFRLA